MAQLDSLARTGREVSVFNSAMKIVALFGSVVFAVMLTYCLLDRRSPARDIRQLPTVERAEPSQQRTIGHYEQRLRAIIARADTASERFRASVPRAQIVSDPSRNTVPQSVVSIGTRQ